ncbi:hypothetical protein GPROT2_00903 [Gammaproteobacteria bacterium]|nr:hypothetical protein [Gammaproteobacteria bacterium]QOJ32982.1 MAG: hypothetical protein HRU81_13110 [Gammaproteobacteria bacterium]CAG0940339.1 hypothetical protein GPROT2_00903 [Gammaproteobacteria bacterium]
MSAAKAIAQPTPAKSKLWKPPIVGLVTFVAMFLAVGLGHTAMVLIEHLLGRETTMMVSPLLGFTGIIMLWYGVKSKNETFQTWIGFFAGLIVWMCWIEFFYMWYGRMNWGMLPRMSGADGLEVSGTYPEYMIMGSTVGLLLMMLSFYTFDKDTRCNMFLWFQDKLGLVEGLGPSTKTAKDRNYAIITFMETIFVTWFCYTWNLLTFDPGLMGKGTLYVAVNMASIFVAVTWAGYCLTRLFQFKRTATALRYGIPVGNIAWVNVEIMEKMDWMGHAVFIEPWKHPLEAGTLTAALLLLIYMLLIAPKKPSELGRRASVATE